MANKTEMQRRAEARQKRKEQNIRIIPAVFRHFSKTGKDLRCKDCKESHEFLYSMIGNVGGGMCPNCVIPWITVRQEIEE